MRNVKLKQTEMKEQTRIFDIVNGKPIVFAYELPNPPERKMTGDMCFDYGYIKEKEEYESSRKEWEVENVKENLEHTGLGSYKCFRLIENSKLTRIINKNQQVQIKEIQAPTEKERGKCKIIKIN